MHPIPVRRRQREEFFRQLLLVHVDRNFPGPVDKQLHAQLRANRTLPIKNALPKHCSGGVLAPECTFPFIGNHPKASLPEEANQEKGGPKELRRLGGQEERPASEPGVDRSRIIPFTSC